MMMKEKARAQMSLDWQKQQNMQNSSQKWWYWHRDNTPHDDEPSCAERKLRECLWNWSFRDDDADQAPNIWVRALVQHWLAAMVSFTECNWRHDDTMSSMARWILRKRGDDDDDNASNFVGVNQSETVRGMSKKNNWDKPTKKSTELHVWRATTRHTPN